MRHGKKGRRLGRNASHRDAMFSNMVTSLVQHKRIETTLSKAKELRGIAEKTITWAVKVADIAQKDPAARTPEEKSRYVHCIRMAKRVVKDPQILSLLFSEVGKKYSDRPGGYTRVIRSRIRVGDAAPMAIIELVGYGRNIAKAA